MNEFYGNVSLGARVGFWLKADDISMAEDKVFDEIIGLQITLKDGSQIEITQIVWDLIGEASRGNVSQPNISDFEIQEETNK